MDHPPNRTEAAHPDSIVLLPDGRSVALKVHRCCWNEDSPENSLPAIRACYRARVARAEIDLNMLRDADFLVTHDTQLDEATTGSGPASELTRSDAAKLRIRWRGETSSERPPLFSEVIAAIREEPYPTQLELDLKDFRPLPWPRAEELARLVEPVRDRVVFGGCADWNLRRLRQVDPSVRVGWDPTYYFDWTAGPPEEPLPTKRGAYGYLDDHPLAVWRLGEAADYLEERFATLIATVSGIEDMHLSLATFERVRADGLHDLAGLLHRAGITLDVWTLDAGSPDWERRLAEAVAGGADVVTSNTPVALARFLRGESERR